MAKNEIATKKELTMSVKVAEQLRDNISERMASVGKAYMSIITDFARLYDGKGFKALGYKNIDECATMEWGMSHGTTVGLRKVWQLVGVKTTDSKYIIPEKYQEWNYTQLLCIAQNKEDFEKANIKPFEVFTPNMKVKDMVSALQLALDEKVKAEAEAIEAEATEAEATEAEAEAEVEAEAEAEAEAETNNLYDYIKNLTSELKYVKEVASEKGAKVEKIVLIDGAIANINTFSDYLKKSKLDLSI